MSKHPEELILDALREVLAKQRANLREDLREELRSELRNELRALQPVKPEPLPEAQTEVVPAVPQLVELAKPVEPAAQPITPYQAPITEPIVLPTASLLNEFDLEGLAPQPASDTFNKKPKKKEKKDGDPEAQPEQEPVTLAEAEAFSRFQERARMPFTPTNLPRLITSFVFVMIIGLAVVNVPLPMTQGLPLARAMPDRASLIIRDGIVLKASGPEIYMIENNQKRWISSIGAFERHFQWRDVHFVDDEFLARFPDGRPIHLVVKCDSPHVYRIEENKKRWIKNIPTFLGEGHYWGEVAYKSCGALRAIPDGVPIPPDAGKPPQP